MLPDFDTLATEYARYRTGYSDELFDHVLAAAPAHPDVLDLASGTGLAARGLAPRSRRLVACDLARNMLAANPAPERVAARGEALPFRVDSFDLVTCAQAFHWLDAKAAYREMHRVLREEGVAVIWWKVPSEDDPTARAVDDAFERITGKPAPRHPQVWRPPPPAPGLFEVSLLGDFPQPLRYTVDQYVGMMASRENLRLAAGDQRAKVLAETRRVLERMHPDGAFTVPYVQRAWVLR